MQSKVLLKPYRAVNGEFASINPYANAVPGFLADSTNGAYVGRFVWRDATNASYVKCAGTGAPLGIILREMVNPIAKMHVEASDFVEPTYQVTVAVTGDVNVAVEAAVTLGQKVFVNTTNGKVVGGAHGASITDCVETNWEVIVGASAGDVATISNHGNTVAALA